SGTPQSAAGALIAFLDAHHGIEPPAVLHPLPTLVGGAGDRRNALLAAGESIVRAAVTHRQARLAAAADSLARAIHNLVAIKQWPVSAAAWHSAQSLAFTLTPRHRAER